MRWQIDIVYFPLLNPPPRGEETGGFPFFWEGIKGRGASPLARWVPTALYSRQYGVAEGGAGGVGGGEPGGEFVAVPQQGVDASDDAVHFCNRR